MTKVGFSRRLLTQRVLLLGGIVASVSSIIAPPAFPQGVTVLVLPPPDRNGADPGDGQNTGCPPGPTKGVRGTPDETLGDSDVDGDGDLDYFMGDWYFVLGTQDFRVAEWCMNDEPDGVDYFTYEIATSENGVETTAVFPGPDHL